MRSLKALAALALLGFSFLLAPRFASAQDTDSICDRTKSLYDCWQVLTQEVEAAKGAKAQRLTEKTAEKVRDKASASTDPGTSSSVLNLLPKLFTALGIDGLKDTEGNLSYDQVFHLSDGLRLDLGATVFGDAKVFEALEKAMPEEVRSLELPGLEDQIGDFDKVDFRAVLAPVRGPLPDKTRRRWLGRDPTLYADLITPWHLGAVVEALKQHKDPFDTWRREVVDPLEEEWEQLKKDEGDDQNAPGLAEVSIDTIIADFGRRGEEVGQQLETGLQSAADAMKRFVAAVEEPLDQADDLIANQPQLLIEGSYNERRDLTGPDEWSLGLKYEVGLFGNLNDLRTWAKEHSSECPSSQKPSYDCLDAYLDQRKQAGENGQRLRIQAQYTRTNPLRFILPEDDFEYSLDRTEKRTGSLTYGRYLPGVRLPNLLQPTAAGAPPEDVARFDLEASYDDVTGDPMRQSRFTATATLSQKMTDGTVLSISAVYANKPEYLGEVDEELSARFGLKWQFDKKKEDDSKSATSSNGGGS